MGRMTIQISDEVDRAFRHRILNLKGTKKGVLGEAVEEALVLWLKMNPESAR